eukprot:scaffold265412_cov32-Tisochrysis_lutea.AAC.1
MRLWMCAAATLQRLASTSSNSQRQQSKRAMTIAAEAAAEERRGTGRVGMAGSIWEKRHPSERGTAEMKMMEWRGTMDGEGEEEGRKQR